MRYLSGRTTLGALYTQIECSAVEEWIEGENKPGGFETRPDVADH